MGCNKSNRKKYYNLEITDEQIKKYWGIPFQPMLSGIFSEIDTYDAILKHYIETSKNFPMKAHSGATEAINLLKKHYLIAALTSSSKSLIFKDLQDAKFNLKDFYFIQTSEDTSFHKPDPKVFIPVEEKLEKKGIAPKDIVYVGDGLRDFTAAKKQDFTL